MAKGLRMRTFGFEATENQVRTSTADQGVVGLRPVSKDSLYVVQCKADGLTLSRLTPYETWEAMSAKARELWKLYLEASKPERVTRLATRYINVMELPLPIPDFRDFLVYGEVSFDWLAGKGRILSVSVGESGRLSYAGMFGPGKTAHGSEPFDDAIPNAVIECIRRLGIQA